MSVVRIWLFGLLLGLSCQIQAAVNYLTINMVHNNANQGQVAISATCPANYFVHWYGQNVPYGLRIGYSPLLLAGGDTITNGLCVAGVPNSVTINSDLVGLNDSLNVVTHCGNVAKTATTTITLGGAAVTLKKCGPAGFATPGGTLAMLIFPDGYIVGWGYYVDGSMTVVQQWLAWLSTGGGYATWQSNGAVCNMTPGLLTQGLYCLSGSAAYGNSQMFGGPGATNTYKYLVGY